MCHNFPKFPLLCTLFPLSISRDRGTGSIVRHRVKEEDNFYLLTANSLVRTPEEADDCAIFFNYDDGFDSKPEDFKQKQGKELIDVKRKDESDIYLVKFQCTT